MGYAGDRKNTPTVLEAREITKKFPTPEGGEVTVISGVSISINEGEFTSLLGPSGSGKSTFLRILAGLIPPSSGTLLYRGQPVNHLRPRTAMVFQNYALIPWLNVLENVELPLIPLGFSRREREIKALRVLDMVGLDGYETAHPRELSGGMKQRVGLARALVVDPEVLLMDEPFSNLDVLTAENLRRDLLELWNREKLHTRSIFMVTHSIEEAVFMSNRCIIFSKNPAKVIAEVEIPLPYPRDMRSKEFMKIVDRIYTLMTKPLGERRVILPEKIEMLPHARPGGIIGLLELLLERGGKVDMWDFAQDLNLEIDDIYPSIEAANLLGFLKIEEGDLIVTDKGREIAEADIIHQKILFREALIDHIPLIRQMYNLLKQTKRRELPRDFFVDLIDAYFSESESEKQIDTAISWGRFAELFGYDEETDNVFLDPSVEESKSLALS